MVGGRFLYLAAIYIIQAEVTSCPYPHEAQQMGKAQGLPKSPLHVRNTTDKSKAGKVLQWPKKVSQLTMTKQKKTQTQTSVLGKTSFYFRSLSQNRICHIRMRFQNQYVETNLLAVVITNFREIYQPLSECLYFLLRFKTKKARDLECVDHKERRK